MASEASSTDGLLGNDPKPTLDPIEVGQIRWRVLDEIGAGAPARF